MTWSSIGTMQTRLLESLGENRLQFHWEMTPELAYGRHRGPARIGSRQAAVAVVLLHDDKHGWTIPLTRRPTTLRHHGGQICFPGGRIETDESAEQAALREFEEELGVGLGKLPPCGRLPKQYVYASDNEVTPLVFVVQRPKDQWSPDPVEVDEVIEMPLCTLIDRPVIESVAQNRNFRPPIASDAVTPDSFVESPMSGYVSANAPRFQFMAPAYSFGEYRIWGATAVILHHLAQSLLSAGD